MLEFVPLKPEAAGKAEAVWTPRAERVLGHAEGLAAGGGARAVGAEHLLLGLLWETEGIGARVFAESGLSYGAAAEALSVPVSLLPDPPDDRPLGPKVDVSLEELEVLLRELPGVIPRDAPWPSTSARTAGPGWPSAKGSTPKSASAKRWRAPRTFGEQRPATEGRIVR